MIETQKLKGTGDAAYAKHLLILGDGFTDTQFHTPVVGLEDRAKKIKNAIASSSWYPGSKHLWIWLAYTPSSAVKDPALVCPAGCGAPAGPKPPSTFRSKYGSGADCRLLSGDSGKVHNLVMDLQTLGQLPNIKSTIVLVNYPVYGGWGAGEISWSSCHPDLFIPLAIHELAHTFGLYDEYENACGVADESGSTMKTPNISSSSKSPLWRNQVNDAWYVKTKSHSTDCDFEPPVPQVPIGAFAGGYYRHVKYYRPAEKCRMRSLNDDFCAVCKAQINLQI